MFSNPSWRVRTLSRYLNKATLIGNLGAQPEIRTLLIGGAHATQFSLATPRPRNDRDGQPQEKTQWYRVVIWSRLPGTFAFVEKYLRKGNRVYVEGEIDYCSYENEGVTRWTTEIRVAAVIAAGERSGSAEGERQGRADRGGTGGEASWGRRPDVGAVGDARHRQAPG